MHGHGTQFASLRIKVKDVYDLVSPVTATGAFAVNERDPDAGFFHNYDHAFPLRYKAQKGYEIRVPSHSIKKFVLKYYLENRHTTQHVEVSSMASRQPNNYVCRMLFQAQMSRARTL